MSELWEQPRGRSLQDREEAQGEQAALSSAHRLLGLLELRLWGSVGHGFQLVPAAGPSCHFCLFIPQQFPVLAWPGSSLRGPSPPRGLSSLLGCPGRAPGVKGAPLLFLFVARTQQKSTLLGICCSHFSKGFICLHLHKKYHTPILMRPIWQYRPLLTGLCSMESCTGQGCDN